jgi:aminopeptidase YwaD
MSTRTFALLFLLFVSGAPGSISAQNKTDRKTAKQLEADITYLASDSLEGRRTGTEGERKAAEYIVKRYTDDKVPAYKGQYVYPFHFVYGKEIAGATKIRVNNNALRTSDDAFPLPFSASSHAYGEILPDVMEQGNIWLLPLYTDQDQANDPHFDAEKFMFEKSQAAEKQGATGVVFYDPFGGKWAPAFNRHSEYETIGIPVVFMTDSAYQKYIVQLVGEKGGAIPLDLSININKAERTGNNIAAYIDNEAKYTVVLGAHYDHLGYGEDGNSLYANVLKEHLIHHGADDNASGTAALLYLANWVRKEKLKNFNYLFLNFSGEELGLFGSKAFVKDQGIDSSHVAYMINMDMLGRLNDSTRALTIGGVGTSPAWADAVVAAGKNFKVNADSSGIGPSDHTSFYTAGIPVLFFFTGSHKDYHKPSDIASLINYPGEVSVIKLVEDVLQKMDEQNQKPAYLVTKEKPSERRSYKVTLGIMPDYTYQDGGVRVDGVTENRPAIRAGIKQGDIITRLGEVKIAGMQSYMEALGKFSPGDKTQVTITRDGREMVLPIDLAK